jgi:hypothetical protein
MATPEPNDVNTSVGEPVAVRSATAAWTVEAIQALGAVTTVPVAASIFGLSRSVAYDLIRAGTFPVPVLRFGTRYRVAVRAILAALHMPTDPDQPGST